MPELPTASPSPARVRAARRRLPAPRPRPLGLLELIDQAYLNDHGVILEYKLGNTSKRLDAMLTGHWQPMTESEGCAA